MGNYVTSGILHQEDVNFPAGQADIDDIEEFEAPEITLSVDYDGECLYKKTYYNTSSIKQCLDDVDNLLDNWKDTNERL